MNMSDEPLNTTRIANALRDLADAVEQPEKREDPVPVLTWEADAEDTDIIVPPESSSLHQAFADGTYPEWLYTEAVHEQNEPHIATDIARELEKIRLLPSDQRLEEYNWIVRYYSRSNKSFEGTSLKLYDYTGYSDEHIQSGSYDSVHFANALLARLKEYDAACVVPVIQQVRDYLVRNFSNTNILFLGRDFCSTYLYIINPGSGGTGSGGLDRKNLFLSNVSRYVRDVALGGSTTELRLVLERIGLTKSVLLQKGLLIADSCMQGKIPAIILKSLALGMDESERYQFLTQCGVRYLKSSRIQGRTIAEKTIEIGKVKAALTDADLDTVLAQRIERIEEFPVDYPKLVQEFVPRRHKIFEWRPKLSLIAMGIEVDELGPRLVANEPTTPSEKVLSLLGLYGEIELMKAALAELVTADGILTPRGLARIEHDVDIEKTLPNEHHGNFEPSKMALEISLLEEKYAINHAVAKRTGHHVVSASTYEKPVPLEPGWFLREIEAALRSGGIEGLRAWQNQPVVNVGSVAVMRTSRRGESNCLYELVINGKVIYRFKDIVGEGNNVKVYSTEKNSVVKVIKDPKHVRKNLLLAWAEPVVRDAGIRTAKVLGVSPTGLYLEQEAVPGTSLESLYGESQSIPAAICERAVHDFRAAKKLIAEKGIWLDLKSANYHIAEDPASDGGFALVNVDYAPRLNPTYYRYFQNPASGGTGSEDTVDTLSEEEKMKLAILTEKDRRELTEDEFLDKFFHHDVRKRCKRIADAAKAGPKK